MNIYRNPDGLGALRLQEQFDAAAYCGVQFTLNIDNKGM
jgi:hypothetical protein